MLSLFSRLAFASEFQAIKLSSDQYKEVLSKYSARPFFILFFSPQCGACVAFRPTWEELVSNSWGINGIFFGEVNCLADDSICRKFDIQAYPTMLLVQPNRQNPIKYEGSHDSKSLFSFILSQKPSVLRFLPNSTAIPKDSNSSIFLLQTSDERGNSLSLFTEAAIRYSQYGAIFAVLPEKQEKLSSYRTADSNLSFDGQWTQEAVSEFVEQNLFPYFPPVTNGLLSYCMQSNSVIFVFFLRDESEKERFYPLAESLSTRIQSCYSLPNDPLFKSEFGESKRPFLIALNEAGKKYKKFEGRISFSEVNDWILGSLFSIHNWKPIEIENSIRVLSSKKGNLVPIVLYVLILAAFIKLAVNRRHRRIPA